MTDGLNLTINAYEHGIEIKAYTLPLGEEVFDASVMAQLLAKAQVSLMLGAMNVIKEERAKNEEN